MNKVMKQFLWLAILLGVVSTGLAQGPIAAYHFNEGTGTALLDASGNNVNGVLQGGATWSTQGQFGGCLLLNGTTAYVDLGNPPSFNMTGSMTISAWVNAAANPADDGQIVAKSDGSSGWQFKSSPDVSPHQFGIGIRGSGVNVQRYSTTLRQLNTWYFVAGVYNAANQTLSIYVNGVLDNGTLRDGPVPPSQGTSGVNANIGRRTGGFYFNGRIDNMRIYNRALSSGEIVSDMNTPVLPVGVTPSPSPTPTPTPTPTPSPSPTPTPCGNPAITNLIWDAYPTPTPNLFAGYYVKYGTQLPNLANEAGPYFTNTAPMPPLGQSGGRPNYFVVVARDVSGGESLQSNMISCVGGNEGPQPPIIIPFETPSPGGPIASPTATATATVAPTSTPLASPKPYPR